MDPNKIIRFMKEAEKFKTVLRTCRTTAPGRPESDAEHSWHLALFLVLLREELKGLDFERLLMLALLHDLPEIYAGDINPYRGDGSSKDRDEAAAAEKLLALLPDGKRGEMQVYFNEYADQATPEAKLVRALDKLLPLIQNLVTNEDYSSYRALEVRVSEVEEYMGTFFAEDGVQRELYLRLLNEAKAEGVFHDQEAPDEK